MIRGVYMVEIFKYFQHLIFVFLISNIFIWSGYYTVYASNNEVSLVSSESTLKMKVPFAWNSKVKDVTENWYGNVKMKQWYQAQGTFYFYVELADFSDDFYKKTMDKVNNDEGKLLDQWSKQYMEYMYAIFKKDKRELTVTDKKRGKTGDIQMIVYETTYSYKNKVMRGIFVFFLHGSNFWIQKYHMLRDDQRNYLLAQNIAQSVYFKGTGFKREGSTNTQNSSNTASVTSPSNNDVVLNNILPTEKHNNSHQLQGAIVIFLGLTVVAYGWFSKKK